MKQSIQQNIQQRYLFQKFEKKRLVLKILSNNLNFKKHIRWQAELELSIFKRNTSLTRIKNICVLTGRSKSIYKFFKISRLQLHKLASTGFLPGFSKYSW